MPFQNLRQGAATAQAGIVYVEAAITHAGVIFSILACQVYFGLHYFPHNIIVAAMVLLTVNRCLSGLYSSLIEHREKLMAGG